MRGRRTLLGQVRARSPLVGRRFKTHTSTRLRNLMNSLAKPREPVVQPPELPRAPQHPNLNLQVAMLRNRFVAQPFCCAISQPQPLGCDVAQPFCCATFLLRNLFVAQPFCCATSQPQPLGCVVAQPWPVILHIAPHCSLPEPGGARDCRAPQMTEMSNDGNGDKICTRCVQDVWLTEMAEIDNPSV